MRPSWQLAGMWDTLRRNWRVRPPAGAREDQSPQLFLRELEQRRVLSVGVAVALAPVVVQTGMTEGAVLTRRARQTGPRRCGRDARSNRLRRPDDHRATIAAPDRRPDGRPPGE